MKNSMSKIIWIVDNPSGDKFTATRADVNVTSNITREEAEAMLDQPHVWVSAKARDAMQVGTNL